MGVVDPVEVRRHPGQARDKAVFQFAGVGADGGTYLPGGGEAPAARLEFLELALRERQVPQFGDLVPQQVEALLGGPGALAGVLEFRAAGPPRAEGLADGRGQFGGRGIVVEQGELHGPVQQRAVGVLSVHLDERIAQRLERREIHGRAVDEGARAFLPGDPAHEALAGFRRVRERLVLEVVARRGMGVEVEFGGDLAGLRPGTDGGTRRACPEHEFERVQQDRLPGARLAGDHGQSRREREVERFDQREVPHGELSQHDAASLSSVDGVGPEPEPLGSAFGALLEYPTTRTAQNGRWSPRP